MDHTVCSLGFTSFADFSVPFASLDHSPVPYKTKIELKIQAYRLSACSACRKLNLDPDSM